MKRTHIAWIAAILVGAALLAVRPWRPAPGDSAAAQQLWEQAKRELPLRLDPVFRVPVAQRPEPPAFSFGNRTNEVAVSALAHRVRAAAQRYPSDASLLELLGHVLLAQGRDARARESYEKALSLDAERAEARLGLASILGDGNTADMRRALDLLQPIPQTIPAHAASLFNQCMLYVRLGELDAARATHARYVETFGDDFWARMLARELTEEGAVSDE